MTLSLVRVVYAPDSRSVVLLTRPAAAARVRPPRVRPRAPTTAASPGGSAAECSSPGEGRDQQGFLRIAVHRPERDAAGGPTETVRVRLEVRNFYPWLRGSGRFARLGAWLYGQTQLRVHVLICNGFLRSLARPRPAALADRLARGRDRRRRRRRSPDRFEREGREGEPVKMSSDDGKRILVTGATGFVGGLLARRLLADGYEVRCLVREREAERGAPSSRRRAARSRSPTSPPRRASPRRSRACRSPTSSST